ncbi:MAG: hypothetical protein WCD29_19185, partial [Pseudolabrys sp.]
ELRMRSQHGMSGFPHKTPWWGLVWALRAAIFSYWPEPREKKYRPERHYMRGPGPKWRAKHGHFG